MTPSAPAHHLLLYLYVKYIPMSEFNLEHYTLEEVRDRVLEQDPHEAEFHQAVREVMVSVLPFVREHSKYQYSGLIERMLEPERMIMFRVPWIDDQGNYRVNRRSEEHTSELQSRGHLVCRLLLERKKASL